MPPQSPVAAPPAPSTPAERPAEWDDVIKGFAKKHGVSTTLALAVANQENRGGNLSMTWDPSRVSPKGARGIMQLMPDTAKELGVDPDDPYQNIEGGIRYLKQQIDRYGGDVTKGLAAYNAGPGAVDKAGGIPDFPETQDYVQRIMGSLSSSSPTYTHKPARTEDFLPKTDAPPRPSFFQGVKEAVLPFQSWEEAKTFGTSALADPVGTALGVGKGILSASVDQLQKSKEAVVRAAQAPLGSATQVAAAFEAPARVATAIPVVGPAVAAVGEALGRGDVAYAAGQVAGTGASLLAGPAMRGARTAKKGAPPIPLTRGERTGSATSRFAETLVEKTIPGRGRFQAFRNTQQQAILSEVDKVVNRISKLDAPASKVGANAVDAIEQSRNAIQTDARARYALIEEVTTPEVRRRAVMSEEPSQAGLVDEFGQPVTIPKRTMEKVQVGGLQPETRGLKEFAIPLLRRVREESKLVPPDQLRPVIESLTRVVQAPKRMSYQAFQDARSDLLAIARRHGDPIPGKAGGMAKKLAAITDDAMEEAAEGSGITIPTPNGPVPLQQFVRETNALWAEAHDVFNESLLGKMVEAAPERLHLLIPNATLDDIHKIKRYLPSSQQQALKAQLVREWFLKDVEGEPLIPGVAGLPSSQGPTLKGSNFRRSVEKFGEERLTALFGAAEAREMLSLANVAEQLTKRRGDAAAGLISGGINATLLSAGPVALAAAVLGTGGGGALTLLGAGASAAGLHAVARLMTRTGGPGKIRRLVQAIGTVRLPEIAAAAAAVQRAADEIEAEERRMPPKPSRVPVRAQGAGPGAGAGGGVQPPPRPSF